MRLRFQDKGDEVDRELEKEKQTTVRVMIVLFVVIAAIIGVFAWVSGKSLHSYEQNIAVGIACFWAAWMVIPAYSEISTRARETYGMVSAIEKTVAAVKENQKELLEKLAALDEELRSLRQISGA